MRTALAPSAAPQRQQKVTGVAIPAPVGGWDAQSAIAAMPLQNAVTLDNWVPRPGYVECRKGFQNVVTQIPASTQSLLVWRGGNGGVDKMFAAAGSKIYPTSATGRVAGSVVDSLNSSRWQYINFSNSAGNYLLAFNGADTPLKYDGTSWSTNSITGSSLTSTDLIDAMVNKRRVFMAEADTLHIWYLDVEAISGAAALLDLGPIFSLGGTIVAMGAWTIDGGMGSDDMAVFVTSEGQIAVYQGIDPDDANNWSLIGVYTVGKPLGRRALLQYGAELVLLTVNGVIPLSQALKFDRSQDSLVAITAKIQNAFALATASYSSNFGWEAFLYPDSNLAIYNVPITELGTSYQYVQNVQTGAWARFKGLDAYCWAYANGNVYFGATSTVNQWDTTSSDNGTPITCDLLTAYNGDGRPHALKQYTMMRPILRASTSIAPAVDIVTDYRDMIPQNVPQVSDTSSGMQWGSMVWGSMVWGASDAVRLDWASCTGIGYVGAARMRTILAPSPTYFEFQLESGSGNLLLETGVAYLALETVLYPTLTCQLIGFDVMYQTGGVL